MSKGGLFWLAYIALIVGAMLFAHRVAAHGNYTHEEIEWMERQNARDGEKCCNEHDVHIGQDVTWRINAARTHYEVQISGQWHQVPTGRIRAIDREDPSPFGSEAILFYSVYPSGLRIWCFNPDVGG
jgi:hypothetical protein